VIKETSVIPVASQQGKDGNIININVHSVPLLIVRP
jgi:hypothetical protein